MKKYFQVTIVFETDDSVDAQGLIEDTLGDMNCADNVRVVHDIWEELMGKPKYL